MTAGTYGSGKSYGHSVGLSCAFRQWRSDSHCEFLHGYALAVDLQFEADALDGRNWVVDFGDLGEVKGWLQERFDHCTLIAEDDPLLDRFRALDAEGGIQLRVVPAVGCEAFAEMIAKKVMAWIEENHGSRVRLAQVTVREHDGNSAWYRPAREAVSC